MTRTYIQAVSYYLPKKVLTNEDLVREFPEWTIEKIEKKLGIKERHIAANDEIASDMAVSAAEKLFSEYEVDRRSIDYLIFCTQSPDYFLPTTACLIQERLGLSTRIGAIDLNLGCSGFIFGLSIAKGVICGGVAKKVLLITSETYSKYIHPKDKGNRTIFADGAAATLIGTDGIAEIGNFTLGTDGKGAQNLIVKSGGMRHRTLYNDLKFDDYGNPKSSDYIYMDGAEILNYTLDRIPEMIHDVLQNNNLAIEDIDLHIYHQANKYIADLQRRKMKISQEQYYCFYEKVGNTVSSTIPIAIKAALEDGSIKPGYKVLSVAQGLGYSWGGVVLKF
jgi:3-oxoacyl-[acyl-carrier-protein] synthase III